MKKALLFCLAVWLLLFVLPWTRPQALLDWRGATLEQFSGDHPAWSPLDPPYQPEKDAYVFMAVGSQAGQPLYDSDLVSANGLRVAPQFASVARGATDRDVLMWCALSASNSKIIAKNMAVLERRFPGDVALLAWASRAQAQDLSMTTRVPGPLSSGANWSVQVPEKAPYSIKVDYGAQTQWGTMVEKARQGEKLQPRNGFWWWMEAMALLGARRDEEVWPVLRIGSSKTEFNDYSKDQVSALRSAHLKVLGAVPSVFFLENNSGSFLFYSRWREVTRQVCENVMGARLVGRDKVALEGGRDMMLMGRLLRRSNEDISVLVGIAVERIALQSALLPAASMLKRLTPSASAAALAGHPRSLLRYANDLKRKDIALQVTNEWNAVNLANRKQTARLKAALASSSSQIQGVGDRIVLLAVGSQNTGALLVQTLPIPLLLLGVLSLILLRRRAEDSPALPAWTRGLGWSAFALVILLAAQILLSHMVWQYLATNMGWVGSWGYDFSLPRLVTLLPSWVFAFSACVVGVGAVWATVVAARRADGEASLWTRLRGMLSSPDERTGTLNLGPLLQLIAVVGAWGTFIGALGAWFYFPQDGALENQSGETLHDQYAGMALALLCFLAVVPSILFRVRGWGVKAYFRGWAQGWQRFLVAHLVLTTVLYLLLAMSGAFWGARLDAEWMKVNAPQTAAGSK